MAGDVLIFRIDQAHCCLEYAPLLAAHAGWSANGNIRMGSASIGDDSTKARGQPLKGRLMDSS